MSLLEGGRSASGGVASFRCCYKARIALVCDPSETEIGCSEIGCTGDPRFPSHLYSPILLEVVRKAAGIEVALERTDMQDELSIFDALPHFRKTNASDINLSRRMSNGDLLYTNLHVHRHSARMIRLQPSCP